MYAICCGLAYVIKIFSVIKHQTVIDHILSQQGELREIWGGGEGNMSVTLEMTFALHMTFNSVISMY